MQRLFLVTAYRSRSSGESALQPAEADALAASLAAEAAALGFEGTKAAVASDLLTQALGAARAMHGVVSGEAAASPLSASALATAFSAAHGHALAARPSSIPGAGTGVFVAGCTSPVPPGTLVALYPGAAYPPLTHRALPGYPQVDRGGAFLMARYDGAVLDSAAWGRGAGVDARSGPLRDREEGGATGAGPAAAAAEAALCAVTDARHPLALGHLANHPPPGVPPNVMAAAVDVPRGEGSVLGTEPWLRRYLPVAVCGEEEGRRGEDRDGEGRPDPPPPLPLPLPLLALVATRPLPPGTELLLNYRLSPHLSKPDWYAAVDEDEDARRWA